LFNNLMYLYGNFLAIIRRPTVTINVSIWIIKSILSKTLLLLINNKLCCNPHIIESIPNCRSWFRSVRTPTEAQPWSVSSTDRLWWDNLGCTPYYLQVTQYHINMLSLQQATYELAVSQFSTLPLFIIWWYDHINFK